MNIRTLLASLLLYIAVPRQTSADQVVARFGGIDIRSDTGALLGSIGIPGAGYVTSVVQLPDGRLVAVDFTTSKYYVIARDGSISPGVNTVNGPITALALPAGGFLVAGSSAFIHRYDQNFVSTTINTFFETIYGLARTPNPNEILYSLGTLQRLNLETKVLTFVFNKTTGIGGFDLATGIPNLPAGTTWVCAEAAGPLCLGSNFEQLARFIAAGQSGFADVAVLPNGSIVGCAPASGICTIWNANGTVNSSFSGGVYPYNVIYIPDGSGPSTCVNSAVPLTVNTSPGTCTASVNQNELVKPCPGWEVVDPVLDSAKVYPAGTTHEIWSLFNGSQFQSLQISVTVLDNEPPSITTPGDITRTLPPGQTTVPANYVVTASDNCGGTGPVECSILSGTSLGVGTTTVNCQATDGSGNTGTGSFTITVLGITELRSVVWNGRQYILLGRSDGLGVSAVEAQAYAAAKGGYNLVAINDAEEQTWIAGEFAECDYIWIGATDEAVEGTFLWHNGEPFLYTNWRSGEPNDFGSVEDNAMIVNAGGGAGGWNDGQGTLDQVGGVPTYALIESGPAISPIQDFSMAEDSPVPVKLRFKIHLLADGSLSALADDTTLFPDGSMVVALDPLGEANSYTLTVTPAPNANGGSKVTLSLVSPVHGMAIEEFVVTVTPVNDAPTINRPTGVTFAAVTADTPGMLAITGISTGAPDEIGQGLTITATSGNPPLIDGLSVGAVSPDGGAQLTYTLKAKQFGTAIVWITLKDDAGTENGGNDQTERPVVINVLPSASWVPVITSVVEAGGDNEPTDTIAAKRTGQTFLGSVNDEPTIGMAPGDIFTVGLFGEGVPGRVDRYHFYLDASDTVPVPSYVVGGEYIMTGNDNRDNPGYRLDVTVAQPVNVFMLIDNRLGEGNSADPPTFDATHMQWVLDEEWFPVMTGANRTANTGIPDEIRLDEITNNPRYQYYSIYTKSFPAGTFQLKQADNPGQNMYGVVVKPAVVQVPNFAGLTDQEARESAAAVGLEIGVVTRRLAAHDEPLGVSGQSIPAGESVAPGRQINLEINSVGVFIRDGKADEGNDLALPVLLTRQSPETVTVEIFTEDPPLLFDPAYATPDLDYVPIPRHTITVRFDPGEVYKEVPLKTLTDQIHPEGVRVNLVMGTNFLLYCAEKVNGGLENAIGALIVPPEWSELDHIPNSAGEAVAYITERGGGCIPPPTFIPIALIEVKEDEPYTFTINGIAPGVPGASTTLSAETDSPVINQIQIEYNGSSDQGTVIVTPELNAFGSGSIRFTVNDGNKSAEQEVQVTVTPVNDVPTIVVPAEATGQVGETLMLPFVVSDVETPRGQLLLTGESSNPTVVPASGFSFFYSQPDDQWTMNVTPVQPGDTTLKITVLDGDGATSSADILLHVQEELPGVYIVDFIAIEDSPIWVFQVDLTKRVDHDVTVTVTTPLPSEVGLGSALPGRDYEVETKVIVIPSGKTFAYFVVDVHVDKDPEGIVARFFPGDPGEPLGGDRRFEDAVIRMHSAAGAKIIPALGPDLLGRDYVAGVAHGYIFDDDWGAEISVIPDRTIDEDTSTEAIPVTVADLETNPADLTVTAQSSNQGVVVNLGIILGGAGANRTITLIPSPNQSGITDVTVIVTDGDDNSTEETFTLTVNPVNDAPGCPAIANQQAVEGNLKDVTLTFSDPDNDPSEFVVTATPDDPSVAQVLGTTYDESSQNYVLHILPAKAGGTIVTGTVRDPAGATCGFNFPLHVSPPPPPPVGSPNVYSEDAFVFEDITGGQPKGELVFRVNLTFPADHEVSVLAYTSAEGSTATVDQDYERKVVLLIFEPGVTEKYLRVPILPDSTPEGMLFQLRDLKARMCETVNGFLAGAVGAEIVAAPGEDLLGNPYQSGVSTGYIIDDDNQCPVPIAQLLSPSIAFEENGETVFHVVSLNNESAVLLWDGSQSTDPEGRPLRYGWLVGPVLVATSPQPLVVLELGENVITLIVTDDKDCTTSVVIKVTVVTPAELTEDLIGAVDGADLELWNKRPLIAGLKAATASFDRGNLEAALNQLQAFQNKVRAQIEPNNPVVAAQLISEAQRVIDAIEAAANQ